MEYSMGMSTLVLLLLASATLTLAAPGADKTNKAPTATDTQCPANIVPAKPGEAAAKNKPFYTTKYDNFDVMMVLRNERLLKNYIDCLMERKPCSKEGQLLKEIIPDALQTECSRCSEKQKQIAGTVMSFLLQNKKKYWDELLCKYDPEGNFRKKYETTDEDYEDED